ncbi:MAG: hypothetical protein Q7U16_06385 [Agitococcus sp.]|nr:hypothetical protein [Agitococcus sp.]
MANRNELIIWDIDAYGTPNNFDEALEMADVLSEQCEDNTSLALKKFASKLSKTAQKAKLDDDFWEGYQTIEQHVATLSYAAFVLEMPDRGWESILKEVVELANKLKLAVVYEEAIMAFLPNNQVLPPENLPYWQAIKASLKARAASTFPKTLKQFKKLMEPKFDVLLTKHGFVGGLEIPEPEGIYSAYSRKLGDIDQYIEIHYRLEHIDDDFTFIIRAGISQERVNNIYEKFAFYKPKPLSITIPISSYRELPPTEGIINNIESAEKFVCYLETQLLPILNQLNSVIAIDSFIQSDHPYTSFPKLGFNAPMRIIFARLANNPKYEELIIQLERNMNWGANGKARATEWPKLLKYLQDEVQPLESLK